MNNKKSILFFYYVLNIVFILLLILNAEWNFIRIYNDLIRFIFLDEERFVINIIVMSFKISFYKYIITENSPAIFFISIFIKFSLIKNSLVHALYIYYLLFDDSLLHVVKINHYFIKNKKNNQNKWWKALYFCI